MSETRRASRREAVSDFSIERILAKDDSPPTASSSSASVFLLPGRTCSEYLSQNVTVQTTASTAFMPQNKLDWLRNLCRLKTTAKQKNTTNTSNPEEATVDSSQTIKQFEDANCKNFSGEELSWLRCTRYCPPKLPRKSSTGKSLKRKPGSHPRIPFTKYQLEVLEDKYKASAYLSREDVTHLSDLLNLPPSRIKIWFQNRRARERRESQSVDQTRTTRI